MAKLAERFGKEVRARRKARGLTQAQLADAANLSEEWVRRIERGVGAPSFDAIDALGSALGTPVADFFRPLEPRDARAIKIDALLSRLDETELEWIETVIRAATAYPR